VKQESGRVPERAELEAMVADGEAQATEGRRFPAAPDRYRELRASRQRASEIVVEALGLSDAARAELQRLKDDHDAALRRFAFEAKEHTLHGSAEASRRLEALAGAERTVLDPDRLDEHSPWITSSPPVVFIRATPTGGDLHDSSLDEGNVWAKWRCTTAHLSSGTEKVSFFHAWQNPHQSLVLADITVKLNLTGHFECSAEGWGVPAGWFTEERSVGDLAARLTLRPLWIPYDPSQHPQNAVQLERLVAVAGVFDDTEETAVNASALLTATRFAVPAASSILIEAAVAVDYANSTDVDFASGDDFRVSRPYCFVTVPRHPNL
jgi:hypothetical protein